MIQLKFYGLGGQGVVTAAKVLSEAVSLFENKNAITIPSYGHERRGAPVNTSVIIDEEPVLINSFVYEPDIVLVMDPAITEKAVAVSEGIKKESVLVINTDKDEMLRRYLKYGFKKIYYADATRIALEFIGKAIPNSSMLGVLAATGCVKINSLEKAIISVFGIHIGEKNFKAARDAYETTKEI